MLLMLWFKKRKFLLLAIKNNKLNDIMKEQIHKSTSRKATAEQSISFYERQKNFLSKAESKIAIMRAEKTKNENPDYSGIPSINKTSKSLKRSFNDLLTWKTTVNAKVVKRREQKEKEELLSLKTYKSSTSGNLNF